MKAIGRFWFRMPCWCIMIWTLILFALVPVRGLAAQTGDVIFAVGDSAFNRVGGDPATFAGGSGPSVSHTVFDGLTIEDWDKRDIPAIAKQALAEANMNYPVPRYMTEAECGELVGRMLARASERPAA